MPMESSSVDHWRKYFLTAKSDIVDVVENAIRVAISDCPNELLKKRDKIAEMMFSYTKTGRAGRIGATASVEREGAGNKREVRQEVCGSEKSDGAVSKRAKGDMTVKRSEISANRRASGDMNVSNRNVDDRKNPNNASASEEMNVNNSSKGKEVDGVNKDAHGEMQVRIGNVCSSEDIEALSDKIDEDNVVLKEISRIKEILINKYETHAALLDSLWRLQYMGLSVDDLKATSIEEVVSPLCMHVSKEIRDLAQAVVKEWTAMKDEWVKSKEPIADTPASVKPYASSDQGLPCPPFDDYCLPAEPTDLSEKIFEDLDHEGNPQDTCTHSKIQLGLPRTEFLVKDKHSGSKNQEAGGVRLNKRTHNETTSLPDKHAQNRSVATRARPEKHLPSPPGCEQDPIDAGSLHRAPGCRQADIIPKKSSCTADSTPDRRQKLDLGHRMKNASEAGPGGQDLYKEKFEAAKKRIRECYEKAGEEKKQRTVQVLDTPDIPKRRLNLRDPRLRTGFKDISS